MGKRKIEVEVRPINIALGVPGEPDTCPIALAIKKKYLTDDVEVGCEGVTLNHIEYVGTKKLKDFVKKFDNGIKVNPTKFMFVEQ